MLEHIIKTRKVDGNQEHTFCPTIFSDLTDRQYQKKTSLLKGKERDNDPLEKKCEHKILATRLVSKNGNILISYANF